MRKYSAIVLTIVGVIAIAAALGLITGALAQVTTTEPVTTTEAATTTTDTGTTTTIEIVEPNPPLTFIGEGTTTSTVVISIDDGPSPTTVQPGTGSLTG